MKNQKAWVVFTGKADIWWLKFLKPGFRHCYVLMNDGHRWFSIDPLSTYTDVVIHHHVLTSFDLPKWLEERGNTVVRTQLERDLSKPAPFMLFSCVEAVKRVLGIHSIRIVTPRQLYNYLVSSSNNQESNQEGEYCNG